MGYQIKSLPDGVGPREAFDAMILTVESGGRIDLPKGYDVEWRWRNAPHLPLRSDPFTKTVIDSARGGFRDLMVERLRSDRDLVAGQVDDPFAPPPQRKTKRSKGGRSGRVVSAKKRRVVNRH